MSDPIVKIEGLWKRYGLPPSAGPFQMFSNLRHGRRLFWTDPNRGPWSLQDINLEINRGEVFGIIGRNGAGKSTLLKILAGVSRPTRGNVDVKGRIFPMIELNAGMHFDLSGRENVRLLGAVMGMTNNQVRRIEPEVEEFCELGEYFDMPVRTYSSGMIARLGFGVAMNVQADILLVDEVLSVGDVNFQRKALKKMQSLMKSGVTVVFVSHAIHKLEAICDRVAYLNAGRIQSLGEPVQICKNYLRDLMPGAPAATDTAIAERSGSGDIRFTEITITGGHSGANHAYCGENLEIHLDYEKAERLTPEEEAILLREVNLRIDFVNDEDQLVMVSTAYREKANLSFASRGRITCRVADMPLLPGIYRVDILLAGLIRIDEWKAACNLIIEARDPILMAYPGMVYSRTDWSSQ